MYSCVGRYHAKKDARNVAPFDPVDISGYSEISFAFLVLGTSDVEQSLKVSFVSGGTEYVYSVNIPTNGWYTVFCDVSDFSVKLLESVTVYTTSSDQNTFVTSIAISSLMCGDTAARGICEAFFRNRNNRR